MVLTDEPLVPLKEAVAFFGRVKGKAIHPCTLTRWVLAGVRVGKQRVRLEGVRQGSKWFTSREAAARFLEATTRAALPHAKQSPRRTEEQRAADHEATENALAAVGW